MTGESRVLRDKALEIYKRLDREYPEKISFIEFRSSYELLICVILSAQTTDRQVMQAAEKLFKKYPDPESLAFAKQGEVEEIIRSTGFYRVKANNIIKTAGILSSRFKSAVPDLMEDLLTLPGVGRKSANVILGTVYSKPAVIVDTHFKRVSLRLGLALSRNPDIIEKEIKALLDEKYQYRFSMTVNLHGRVVCHPSKPECEKCILNKLCLYMKQ